MKKVAIITGGTQGIGLGITKVFLENDYQVLACYRSDKLKAEQAAKKLNSNDLFIMQADVGLFVDRERLLKECIERFGRMDVLVNNAGIIRMSRFLEITPEVMDEVMQTNFYGPMYLSQSFAKKLIEDKKVGNIINITTMGIYGPGNVSYCTSKAALQYLTRCMARELAKYNIRVNSVSPGMVATNLNQQNRENSPEVWQKMLKKVPLKREAEACELGEAVFFLASEKASYITGRDLVVDGGYLG